MRVEPVAALDSVTVTHASGDALRDVDLAVAAGSRVGIIGPSGAGKTTLLRLLNGTLSPTLGTVRVLGRDPAAADEAGRRLRRRIGTVPQQLDLVGPLRVIHNVNAGRLGRWSSLRSLASLVRPAGRREVRGVLEQVGIGHLIDTRVDQLSGGEQQRVALARVLIQDPAVLLADEPVSNLDPGRAHEVMALLVGLAVDHQRTLVVSLHDLELARRSCERLVGLRHGRVVFDLPADDLDGPRAAELYRIEDLGPVR